MEDPGPEAAAQQAEDGTVQGVLDGALHQQVISFSALIPVCLSGQCLSVAQQARGGGQHRAGRVGRRAAPAGEAHSASFKSVLLNGQCLSNHKWAFPRKCLERRWPRAGRAARRTAPAGAHCRSFPT